MGRQTQTRDRLVETAAELFWNQGYARTGVSSIMKQARATSGSFYHFFPTKDDLLLAVLDAVGDFITSDVLEAAEAASGDSAGRVSVVIDAYRDRTGSMIPGYGIPIGTLVGELGFDHPEALDRVEKIYSMMISRIGGWFVDTGSPWSLSDDPSGLARFIVGALEGASMMAIAGGSRNPIDECAEQLRLHLDSLAMGGGPRSGEAPPPEPVSDDAVDWKAW